MRNDRGAEGVRYLLAEYCHTIDDGRDEDWAALFQADAAFTLDGLGELSGRDSVRTFVTGALKSLVAHGISGINHLTYNTTIGIDGERATATSDLAVMVPAQGAFTAIALGRYHDVLVLEDRWRFQERRISWFKDNLPAAFGAALAPIFERQPA
jgi:hypothetical protein